MPAGFSNLPLWFGVMVVAGGLGLLVLVWGLWVAGGGCFPGRWFGLSVVALILFRSGIFWVCCFLVRLYNIVVVRAAEVSDLRLLLVATMCLRLGAWWVVDV